MTVRKTWIFACVLVAVGIFFRFYGVSDRVTQMDDIAPLAVVFHSTSSVEAGEHISGGWTYGPLQFRYTWYTIQWAQNWREMLFYGRLPSVVCSALSIVLFAGALGFGFGWSGISLWILAIAVCSIHSITDAQQVYPYASTTLCAAIAFCGLACSYRFRNRFGLWCLATIAMTMAVTKLAFASYTNMLLFPGMYIGAALIVLDKAKLRDILKNGRAGKLVLLGGCTAISLYIAQVLYTSKLLILKSGGYAPIPSWAREEQAPIGQMNAGLIFNWLEYMSHRVENLVFYQLTPIWPTMISPAVMAAIKMVCLLFFLYSLFEGSKELLRRRPFHSAIFVMSLIPILAMATLHIKGDIPFGATRHSQILMYPLLGILWFGWNGILSSKICGRITNRLDSTKLQLVPAALVVLMFLCCYPVFSEATKNNVDVGEIDDACAKSISKKVVGILISADYTLAQKFFPNLYKGCKIVTEYNALESEKFLTEFLHDETISDEILTSHTVDIRKELSKDLEGAFKDKVRLEVIRETHAIGSVEPLGNMNGGNAQYLARLIKIKE